MRFDAIVVPRGAEARAVERGWTRPRPPILAVPAGSSAGARFEADGALPATVVVMGLCGALDPQLRVGDTVVYARIAVEGLADPIELDPELAAACAVACDRPPLVAANVTRVVGSVAAKAALRVACGAAVIDMEAAALARALHERGARVAMVRVVSDDARRELPDLAEAFDEHGALRPTALTAALARTPLRGARFVLDALRALRALRRTASRLADTAPG